MLEVYTLWEEVNTLWHGCIRHCREKTLAHMRESPQQAKTLGKIKRKTSSILETRIEIQSQQGVTRTHEGKTLAETED